MRLLSALLDAILPPRASETLVRHASVEAVGAFAAPQLVETCVPATTALLPYRAPLVRALIVEAKYRNSAHAHAILGAVLREYLEYLENDRRTLAGSSFVLVPVPLGRKRQGARGYNQAERICRAALVPPCEGWRLETDLLVRDRETAPQTSLSRDARRENVRGAFHVSRPLDPSATYIVVVDVVTTGATLSSAAAALREAGARSLEPLALAH
jgi:ComF family protein